MTHFEKSNESPNRITFKIKDIDLSIVNAIRRIILSEIPTIAFAFDVTNKTNNDINIHKNTSALHNEFLAHRISLLPICVSEDDINTFESDNKTFKLVKKNTTSEIVNVTSKDIMIYNEKNEPLNDEAIKKIFPPSPITGDYILITKLKPNLYSPKDGEELDIECKASKNIGMTHARWSPVSQSSFINSIDEELAKKAYEEKIASKELTDAEKQAIFRQFQTLEQYRHFKKNKFDEPNAFDFTIETECALRPTYLFHQAILILIDKLHQFIKNIDDEKVIKIKNLAPAFFELEVINETYTLINVLQANIYNNNRGTHILEFIGYYNPHPLDNKMMLKIKFYDKTTILKDAQLFMTQNCKVIIDELTKYADEWKRIFLMDIKLE